MKTIWCKVIAGAKKSSVEELNNTLVVKVKEKPVKNKANIELIKLLKEKYRQDVEILKGKTSNKKLIKIGE